MKTIVPALLALIAVEGRTQDYDSFVNGTMLLQPCEVQTPHAQATCNAYIAGIHDLHDTFVAWGDMQNLWCIPKYVILPQLQYFVVGELTASAETLGRSASTHVANALIKTYPCEPAPTTKGSQGERRP